jgi:hypothetical protein
MTNIEDKVFELETNLLELEERLTHRIECGRVSPRLRRLEGAIERESLREVTRDAIEALRK